MGAYDRIANPMAGPGAYTNPAMLAACKTVAAIEGRDISDVYCYQGSFNVGYAPSAGTHDKADCLDIKPSTWNNRTAKKVGIASFRRTTAQGFSLEHDHMVRIGTSGAAWLADAQEEAYVARRSNGLGDLSHYDTSYCPKYRDVRHISGPSSRKYIATKETWGWAEAGCHGSTAGDAPLHVKTRAKGYVLSNIAGRVRCNGSEYFVTTGCTFYNVANFEPYVAPAPAPTSVAYYVKGAFALGHQDPSATSRRVGEPRLWGALTPIAKTTTVNGALWGWYDPADSEGRWYLIANLTKTKPTSKIEKIDTLTIGSYNVAAQAAGHASTYPKRAPLSARHMVVDAPCDVWGVVEYGSASAKHANGKTYLQISDEARKALSSDLVRMPHGTDWRYLLRRESATDYMTDSGKAVTLTTHVDANGTQVVMGGIWKNDVKHLIAVTHLDVNSTESQYTSQARELMLVVEEHRKAINVAPWNVTIVGDFNVTSSVVDAVLASWGFVSLAVDADETYNAGHRTTNRWEDVWTDGPHRDKIYVFEGSGELWHQRRDATAADHNPVDGARASYGTRL